MKIGHLKVNVPPWLSLSLCVSIHIFVYIFQKIGCFSEFLCVSAMCVLLSVWQRFWCVDRKVILRGTLEWMVSGWTENGCFISADATLMPVRWGGHECVFLCIYVCMFPGLLTASVWALNRKELAHSGSCQSFIFIIFHHTFSLSPGRVQQIELNEGVF